MNGTLRFLNVSAIAWVLALGGGCQEVDVPVTSVPIDVSGSELDGSVENQWDSTPVPDGDSSVGADSFVGCKSDEQCPHNPCVKSICKASVGECVFFHKTCNDGDECTADSCDVKSGQCAHTSKGDCPRKCVVTVSHGHTRAARRALTVRRSRSSRRAVSSTLPAHCACT